MSLNVELIDNLKVMKRSGKITDAHINEMMKKGDLDGDGWETTFNFSLLEREGGGIQYKLESGKFLLWTLYSSPAFLMKFDK